LKPVAKRLGLIEEEGAEFAMQNFNLYADELSDMPVWGVHVPNDSPAVGKYIKELGLPEDVRIVAIRQKEHYSTPKGKTMINAGDRICSLRQVRKISVSSALP
jgi:Trk K+ transport system NAD-binding subunit